MEPDRDRRRALGYYEELAAACAGAAMTVPVTDAIPTGPNEPPRPGAGGDLLGDLSGRALKQVHGLPGPAFESLIEVMAEVTDYPDDPLWTFPTSDLACKRSTTSRRPGSTA